MSSSLISSSYITIVRGIGMCPGPVSPCLLSIDTRFSIGRLPFYERRRLLLVVRFGVQIHLFKGVWEVAHLSIRETRRLAVEIWIGRSVQACCSRPVINGEYVPDNTGARQAIQNAVVSRPLGSGLIVGILLVFLPRPRISLTPFDLATSRRTTWPRHQDQVSCAI